MEVTSELTLRQFLRASPELREGHVEEDAKVHSEWVIRCSEEFWNWDAERAFEISKEIEKDFLVEQFYSLTEGWINYG